MLRIKLIESLERNLSLNLTLLSAQLKSMWKMLKRITLNLKSNIGCIQSRFLSNVLAKYKENVEDKMQAWQIHSYGGLEELKLSNVRIPVIAKPTDILVKVEASSVNSIDIAMTSMNYLILIVSFFFVSYSLNDKHVAS